MTPPGLAIQRVADAHRLFGSTPSIVPQGAMLSRAVEECLRNPNSNSIYVVDKDSRIVGTIHLSDLLRIASARYQVRREGLGGLLRYLRDQVDMAKVDDAMAKPLTVQEGETLIAALHVMIDNRLAEVPVVDSKGRLVGELNAADILSFLFKAADASDSAEADAAAHTPP